MSNVNLTPDEIIYTNGNAKKCTRCKEVKAIGHFDFNERGIYFARCRQCLDILRARHRKLVERGAIPSPRHTMQDTPMLALVRRRITNALQRNFKSYRDIEQSDISMAYILALYDTQRGMCALSGRRLSLDAGKRGHMNPDTLSIDRIDSSKGYVRGNVQLVTFQVNVAKQAYSNEEFISMCQAVVEHHTMPMNALSRVNESAETLSATLHNAK